MKTKFPLISVVMLNFNGLKYIKRTIPLILRLDYPNYEFIIVDNGSTDGSIEFIKKFKKIKLIENGENLGYSKGKNIGVKAAKGEYILLLDNDIKLIRGDTVNKLISQCGVDEIISPLIFNSSDLSTKYYGTKMDYLFDLGNLPQPIRRIKDYSDKIVSANPYGGAIFTKKSYWNKIGGFDESQPFNVDDIDFGLRSWIMGYKVYISTIVSVEHIGIESRNNLDTWCWKFKYYFSGMGRTIIKNFTLLNAVKFIILYWVYTLFKAFFNSLKFCSFKPVWALIFSYWFFIINISDTLMERKIIQERRVIKEDNFLKIRPPNFN